MKMTSAYANKMIRKLNEDKKYWREIENVRQKYVVAQGEEPIIPEYDSMEVHRTIADLDDRIVRIKHALNQFNVSQMVGDMTIDEVLVYLPQQSERVSKLSGMAGRMSRQRCSDRYGSRNNLIEYEYANFDQAEAQRLYDAAHEDLIRAQVALDRENTTVEVP